MNSEDSPPVQNLDKDEGLAQHLLSPNFDKDGRVGSPHEFFKPHVGEDTGEWTDRLVRAGSYLGVYRQCSIGWHSECSTRDDGPDADCKCNCHTGHRYGEGYE